MSKAIEAAAKQLLKRNYRTLCEADVIEILRRHFSAPSERLPITPAQGKAALFGHVVVKVRDDGGMEVFMVRTSEDANRLNYGTCYDYGKVPTKRSQAMLAEGEWRTPSGESLDEEDVNKLRAELASAYLELVPESEAEPLDEAYLRSVGFRECDDSLRYQKSFLRGIVLCVAFATEGPKCWTWHMEIFIAKSKVTIAIDPTRGDLRALLKGLKLPLSGESSQ